MTDAGAFPAHLPDTQINKPTRKQSGDSVIELILLEYYYICPAIMMCFSYSAILTLDKSHSPIHSFIHSTNTS